MGHNEFKPFNGDVKEITFLFFSKKNRPSSFLRTCCFDNSMCSRFELFIVSDIYLFISNDFVLRI